MGAVCVPGTPEIYAGYYRGASGNPGGFREDAAALYADPGGYREGNIHLQGRWLVDAEAARFVGPEPGYLRVAYRGSEVNAVLAPGETDAAIRVAVARTGLATAPGLPPGVSEAGDCAGQVVVDAPRLYSVLRDSAAGDDGLKLLTLIPARPGLGVYSFTFGACTPAGAVSG